MRVRAIGNTYFYDLITLLAALEQQEAIDRDLCRVNLELTEENNVLRAQRDTLAEALHDYVLWNAEARARAALDSMKEKS